MENEKEIKTWIDFVEVSLSSYKVKYENLSSEWGGVKVIKRNNLVFYPNGMILDINTKKVIYEGKNYQEMLNILILEDREANKMENEKYTWEDFVSEAESKYKAKHLRLGYPEGYVKKGDLVFYKDGCIYNIATKETIAEEMSPEGMLNILRDLSLK